MRSFDFGLFLPIANNGMIASMAYQYMPTFDLNRHIAMTAEETGYSFLFAMTKWRGYGGTTQHWDHATEAFTLMAGLGAVTEKIGLAVSIALPTLHPAVAARMAVTVDDISRGRLMINIVAGWNKYEYSQMGLWRGDDYYAYRYDYAAEYVDVLRKLWAQGRVTHKGTWFDLDDCVCLPLPSRRIPLIGAGQSEKGMRSAAQWADYNFVFGDVRTAGGLSDRIRGYASEVGRDVETYVLIAVVAEETDAEAARLAAHIEATADIEAVETWRRLGAADEKGSASFRHKADAFMGVTSVIGSYDTVAAYFDELSASGIKGAAITFPDWRRDVRKFGENVIPRMKTLLAKENPASQMVAQTQ